MSQPSEIISLKNVHKAYKNQSYFLPVLTALDLTVHTGDLIVVCGVSGTGKSTLLNLIGALDTVDKGNIIVDDINLSSHHTERKLSDFRKDKIGFVFQQHYLMKNLTVLENVMISLMIQKVNLSEAKHQAMDFLAKVGMADRKTHYPHELSGGESQRVAMARALAKEPSVILADEPTGNLDTKNTDNIIQLLDDIHKLGKLTILIVTHEYKLTEIANTCYTMSNGQLHAQS